MGGSDDAKSKKRKKSYYINSAKKKRFSLDGGMKGFLITCNNREKEAVKEAYNILNEYADKLYGPEQVNEEKDSSDEGDIEDALQKEVTALQAETSGEKQRRFQVVDSGAKNCVFIKTTLDKPCELAHAIFSDVAETGKQKSRFILRLLPISDTCKANEEAVGKIADQFLDTNFGYAENGRTFSIQFKTRNNNQIGRNFIFNMLGKIVSDMHPGNKVNLNNSEETIIVDVLRKVCCLSVVKDFFKFKKYNLFEVAKGSQQKDHTDSTHSTESSSVKDSSCSQQQEGKGQDENDEVKGEDEKEAQNEKCEPEKETDSTKECVPEKDENSETNKDN